jgi:hypothetical protein
MRITGAPSEFSNCTSSPSANLSIFIKSAPEGGREHCQAAVPPNPKNRNLKNTDFVDIMMSNILHDLPFSQNQPVKSADN